MGLDLPLASRPGPSPSPAAPLFPCHIEPPRPTPAAGRMRAAAMVPLCAAWCAAGPAPSAYDLSKVGVLGNQSRRGAAPAGEPHRRRGVGAHGAEPRAAPRRGGEGVRVRARGVAAPQPLQPYISAAARRLTRFQP
eukprot:gene3174-biopygen7396